MSLVAAPARRGARGAGERAVALGRLAGRGGLAVADQALYGAAGFGLNLLLARWLDPASYGAFALGFSVLLIASSLHNALVLEPMSVLGPARHHGRLGAYLRAQVALGWRLMAVPAAGLVAAGGAMALAGQPGLGAGIAGAGIALPFVLTLWTARRAFFVLRRPGGAVAASGRYLVLLGAGAAALRISGSDGTLSAFLLVGAAAAAAGALALRRAGAGEAALPWRPLLAEQWRYGRWMVVAAGLTVAGVHAQVFIAAGFLGLEGAGALRAMEVLVLPAAQAVTAIAAFALPSLSFDFGAGRIGRLRRKGLALTGVLGAGAVAYEAALVVLHRPLERLLFDGKYAEFAWLIPVLGLVPVLAGLTTGLSLALRAVQRPAYYLLTAIATAVLGIASAIVLTPVFGLRGAAASILLGYVGTLLVSIVLFRAWIPRTADEPADSAVVR